MPNQQPERFFFSAYANSVGAVLKQPLKVFLSDVPCAAIPVTGGLISQSRENLSFKIESHEILRTGRVSATVFGEPRGDHYVTLATTTVEDLNILNVITADAVMSRVTSVYPANDDEQAERNPGMHEARFFLTGPHFDNLKIGGRLIEPVVQDIYIDEGGVLIREQGSEHTSLFTEKFRQFSVTQFGTIHLGDVDTYNGKVILTMLRVELGSPIVGTAIVATASTNGTDD